MVMVFMDAETHGVIIMAMWVVFLRRGHAYVCQISGKQGKNQKLKKAFGKVHARLYVPNHPERQDLN